MIEVTTRDTEDNVSETRVVPLNDYVLIVTGTAYIDNIQDYPTTGTRVITIKGLKGTPVP